MLKRNYGIHYLSNFTRLAEFIRHELHTLTDNYVINIFTISDWKSRRGELPAFITFRSDTDRVATFILNLGKPKETAANARLEKGCTDGLLVL